MHKYQIHKETEIKNGYGIVIGTAIVSRCNNCGKIRIKRVFTDSNYN